MIFSEPIYAIFLDGTFVGITNDEMECWEIAEEKTYGTPNVLHHDNVDRVWWHKININRFYCDGITICDTISEETILCHDKEDCETGIKLLNSLSIINEREEAKKRAMTL